MVLGATLSLRSPSRAVRPWRRAETESLRQAVLLSPITGERSLLVRWSREDSQRACRAHSESSREYCRKPNRWAAVARPRRRRAGSPPSTIVLSSLSNFSPRLFSFLLASFVHGFYAKPDMGAAVAKIDPRPVPVIVCTSFPSGLLNRGGEEFYTR